jgi:hypothetical protein
MSYRRAQQRPRSLSSASEASTASEEEMESRAARSRRQQQQQDMTGRREGRRVTSHSTPSLVHYPNASTQDRVSNPHSLGLDGAHHSNEANAFASPSAHQHPPRTHSHGAVASHFLAQDPSVYGGQTWVDFLRESGVDENGGGNGARQSLGPMNSNMGPPPLPDHRNHATRHLDLRNSDSRASSRFTLPTHPSRPIEPTRREDRKRRLTTPESPLRRPSNTRMRAEGSGTDNDPILLDEASLPALPVASPSPPSARPTTIFPPPSLVPPSSISRATIAVGPVRRESESSIVLPSWQPDADVNHCPVCKSQFTFFYRKHHCRYVRSHYGICPTLFHTCSVLTHANRKCGRVVCSACSPHRITIPRQFIVHPPMDSDIITNIIDLTGDDTNNMSAFGPFRNPALGGGEEVRVCNPCVPDPNYDPPPPYTTNPSQRYSSQNLSPTRSTYPARNASLHGLSHGPPRGHRSSQSAQDGPQTVGHGPTQRPRDPFTGRELSFHNSTRVADLWPPTHASQSGHVHSAQSIYQPHQPGYNPNPHHRMGSNSTSQGQDPGNRRSSLVQRPIPPPDPQQQPVRRREIAEEDECPICGEELPPRGPNGDETEREQHVEDCLAVHSSSPPHFNSSAPTSTSLPAQRTRGMSNAASLLNPEASGSNPANRMNVAARGMVLYKATEKDCIGDDGEGVECVICFDEFEAGDSMGRLVCWCKFHEGCIRQWWEKKGRGACPTHQLHVDPPPTNQR